MTKIKDFILRKAEHSSWLFLAFWCCVFILYIPAYQGGFYEDFLGFLDNHKRLTLWESVTRQTSGMYQGLLFFQQVCISLFGTHPIPWFLLFTGLHAFTAVCIVRFCKGLFGLWQTGYPQLTVLTGVLFWLLTPLAVETVNWKACSHYMIGMIFLFSILKWATDYLVLPRRSILLKIVGTYILSLTFLELFYLTPVFVLLLLVALIYCRKPLPVNARKAGLSLLLPMIVLWCLYYWALQTITGRTLARINSLSELLDPLLLLAKLNKYIVHIYFMEYFLPASGKASIYRFLELPPVAVTFGVFLVIAVLFLIVRMRKAKPGQQIASLLFLMFLISLMFILPMWFFELFPYQGSRYFYFPGAFGYLLLAMLIFRIPWPKLRYTVALLYLSCSVSGTMYLVNNIRAAAITSNKLMDSFKWDNASDVLLLDLPIFYRGIGIMGAGDPSNFAYHLDILRNRKVNCRIYDVSSFNMAGRWDGAHVQVIDSLQLKVSLNQGGTWWWFGGFGAADYENELYKVHFIDNGANYLLHFKQRPGDSTVVLYQSGGDWKRVDWNKKEEQW